VKFSRIHIVFGLLLPALFLLASCGQPEKPEVEEPAYSPPISFDLDSIIMRGKLVLLTENSATSYYLYRGQAKGFDHDMVKAFAKHIGVKLEVKLLDDVDQMFEMLNTGKGDLIATNLTVTNSRKKIVAFSAPVCTTRQVLVQPRFGGIKGDSLLSFISDTAQLKGKEVWAHRYSVFYERLMLMNSYLDDSIKIQEAPGELSTDDLIRLVSEGEISRTITDENLAQLQQADNPNLDMSLAISNEEEIAWAMRSNSSRLLEEVNNWMAEESTQKKMKKTYSKYFSQIERMNYNPVFVPPIVSDNRISAYDEILKQQAVELGWDWRLLAALIYQESRFNPRAKSWSGAFGLMQLMPETARRFGCDTSQLEVENIKAGVKYIQFLDRMWKDKIIDPDERVKFVLGSYNIGPGHIFDARAIARNLSKPDTVWENNVAECLLLKMQSPYYTMEGVKHGYCHAKEPYQFVIKIMNNFRYYQGLKLE